MSTFGKTRLAGALCLLLSATAVRAQNAPAQYKESEVLLKFRQTATASYRAQVLGDLAARDIEELGRTKVLLAHIGGLTVEQAIARHRHDPNLEFIEPNFIYHALDVPNDPRFDELWGMQNTGQTGGTPGADISATAAWHEFTGSTAVVVGIIDSGIDYTHPDLAANIWTNPNEIPGNGIDDDHNGYIDDIHGYDFVNNDGDPMDDHSHGTHCAGTIGGVGDNGIGVAGVNWHVRLMALKFLDAGGSGSTDNAIRAVDYATTMGIQLTSNSWGGGGFSQALLDAIRAADTAGISFVAAAGNASSDNDTFANYPSNYDSPNIIAVAATDHNDQLASFSNWGLTTVDLGAPGVDILSTQPGNTYGLKSGTSMATPHVAGVMALIRGFYPSITAASAKTLLLARVDPIPALSGRTVTGGRLNAFLPIAQPDSLPPGAITDLTAVDPGGSSMTLHWTATGDDGATGRAANYDLRYSTAPLDDTTFGAATQVNGEPNPQTAGSAEQMTVNGLAFSTVYYFAIRAADELGGVGPISNVASATTLGPPDIALAPSSASGDLLTGQTATEVLNVQNLGVSDLVLAAQVRGTTVVEATAVVTRTIARPSASHPFIFEGRNPSYRAGAVPRRSDPLRPIRRPPVIQTGGLRFLILNAGGDVSAIRQMIAAYPDVAVTDVFDLSQGTPILADLNSYDAVMLASDTAIPNAAGVGDLLADYADAGGGVVLTVPTFIGGFAVAGRLVSGGYLPFTLGSGPIGSANLGTFDAGHPIMEGVTSAFGDLLGATTVTPGAVLVASWDNGQPFVATKNDIVVGVNAYVGNTGFIAGDVGRVLHNALAWSGHAVRWLTADPAAAVVAPGASMNLTLTFDATGLNGGNYDAELQVSSNDPDESRVDVPVHLHVTGAPDIQLEGPQFNIQSTQTYTVDGALTQHALPVPVAPTLGGTLELFADGDYGAGVETATVTVEGTTLGAVGSLGADCTQGHGSFPLTPAQLATFAADGIINVQVQNSFAVNVFCTLNQHRVVLSYALGFDPLDFNTVFLGGCKTLAIRVRNTGTDLLTLASVNSNSPVFTPDGAGFALAPGEFRDVNVQFCPNQARVETGLLTIVSDDPDEISSTATLRGEGLVPPDIAVSPQSLTESLLSGATSQQTLHIQNEGFSDLNFTLAAETAPAPATTAASSTSKAHRLAARPARNASGAREDREARSNQAPAGFHPAQIQSALRPAARIALVQDVAPWGGHADESVLTGMALPFDLLTTEGLAAADLSKYRLIVLAGDQPTRAYENWSAAGGRLEPWLRGGGVLEIHAAGWGYSEGDAARLKMPDGLRIAPGADIENQVTDTQHPVARDLSPVITGSFASAGFFTHLAARTSVLMSDSHERPTLVQYRVGAGTVFASALNLEFGLALGEDTGLVLENLLGAALATTPSWLTLQPAQGQIPPGQGVDITVGFNALGLNGGDYGANVLVQSNDPDEGTVTVPVALHVTGAPDIALAGEPVVLQSVQTYIVDGAMTQHTLPVVLPPAGPGTIELVADGDYGDIVESATLTMEGIAIGSTGSTGSDCSPASGTFSASLPLLRTLALDGVIQAQVQNTFDVNVFCTINQHTVRVTYPAAVDSIDFGTVFAGGCVTRHLIVSNPGTDPLTVSSIASANPVFTASPGSFALAPGASQNVTLQFCPPVPASEHGTLLVQSDDPDEASVSIELRGLSVIAPDIAVQPDSIHADLFTGATATRTITIANTGGSPLIWSASALAAAGALYVAPATATTGTSNHGTTVSSQVRGAYPLALGAFQPLASCPVPMTCVTADPGSGFIYAQQNEGFAFYRYRRATNSWEPLAACPLFSGNNGGAMILNGKIYTVYTGNGSQLGVYDIVTNTWTTLANGLGNATGNIATDGQYIYLAGPSGFVRHDPVTSQWTFMAQPVAGFTAWGGLQFHAGKLYGHQGDGFQGFETYDIANNQWASLPPLPGGAVLGSCVDPASSVYYAHGSYGGSNWYAFDIATGQWSAVTEPLFPVSDGGMAVVRGPGPGGVYFVQGEGGVGFGRYELSAGWLRTEPASGSVLPGEQQEIAAVFDAAGLIGGDYRATVEIGSNDPDENPVRVAATLHVTGAPEVSLSTTHLDFGSVFVGGTRSLDLQVTNAGTDMLQVSSVVTDPPFSVTATPFTLAVGQQTVLPVRFDPVTPGPSALTLILSSNDPDDPQVAVALSGIGLIPPQIGVAPDSIHADLFTNGVDSTVVNISNTGGSALDWTIVLHPEAAVHGVEPGAQIKAGRDATPAAAGTFAPLSPSPSLLNGLTTDPATGAIYAFQTFGTGFARYEPSIATWTPLAPQPQALIAAGAVVLNGTLYAVSSSDIALRIYDIAANSWSQINSPLFASTTLIATDGTYLYAARSNLFMRYNPATGQIQPLPAPPVFLDWPGGMQFYQGRLYVHQGFTFLVFDPATNQWAGLANVPGYAGVGSAVDPLSHRYYAAGGTGWQVYDFVTQSWSTESNPLFYVSNGGVTFLSQGVNRGVYFAEGSNGFGFGRYVPDIPFLRFQPTGGTVAPGGNQPVRVLFDAHSLIGGDYRVRAEVQSNDPDDVRNVFASLHVTGSPDIDTPNAPIDFGLTFVNSTSRHDLRVANVGTDVLHITRVQTNNPFFGADSLGFDVAAGSFHALQVTFSPLASGVATGVLTLTSDDPDEPSLPVGLSGLGVLAPDVDLEPDSIAVTVSPGAVVSQTLTISNVVPNSYPLAWQCLSSPIPWLTITPTSGLVLGGQSQFVQIGLDARNLPPGQHRTSLIFATNDSDELQINLPVILNITTTGRLTISPATLDLGTIFLNRPVIRAMTAVNTGLAPLAVSAITSGLPDFNAGPQVFTLQPGQSQALLFVAFPTQSGNRSTSLTFTNTSPESLLVVPIVATAAPAPVAAVQPPIIEATTTAGREVVKSLQICNTGGSDLHFTATAVPPAATPVATHAALWLPKEATDPRDGILGHGGPDAFGYRWTDSDDPGGPAFGWIDISNTGALVPLQPFADEQNVGPFPIGFAFPFYGETFASFRVCTNGYISFTNSNSIYGNQVLPSSDPAAPENLLAAFWDDLLVSAANGARILYQSDATRLVIQYDKVTRFSGGAGTPNTFQIILFANGDIVYQYKVVGAVLNSCTTGMQNGDRTDGLTVVFNAPYLHPSLAIRITRPVLPWVKVTPTTGVVAAGACLSLKVAFDAANLPIGDKNAVLLISTNDPDRPTLRGAARLHVVDEVSTGAAVTPQPLDLRVRSGDVSIRLEPPAPLLPSDVVVASLRVGGEVAPLATAPVIGDQDGNGIPDLVLCFDRAAVQRTFSDTGSPALEISGQYTDGRGFRRSAPVTIVRHIVTAPRGGERVACGRPYTIRWSLPLGWTGTRAEISWSPDDGATWATIAADVTGTSVTWTPPNLPTTTARVRVVLADAEGFLARDATDAPFGLERGTTDTEPALLPRAYALLQNTPNPFNPSTLIPFELPSTGWVQLDVFDAAGQHVRRLVHAAYSAGRYTVDWNGRDARGRTLPSGVYFYRMQSGAFTQTRRLLLLK